MHFNILIKFFFITLLWILLISSISFINIIIGILIVIPILYFSAYFFENSLIIERLNIKNILRLFFFIVKSLKEIIKSNIDVAERVLDPSLPIDPYVVKINTSFKNDPLLFTLLANTITLTPGTLTIDYTDEYIYVHFLAEDYIEALTKRNLPLKIKEIFS